MALFRLQCLPSATRQLQLCSTQTTPVSSSLLNPSKIHCLHPLSTTSFSRSLTISTKTHKSKTLISGAAVESPQVEESQSAGEVQEREVEDEASRTRVIAQNIPWTSTEDDMRALFGQYGTVVSVEFSMYNKTKNRGIVFIAMGSNEEAAAAIAGLSSSKFEDRTINVTWANPKKKNYSVSVPPKSETVHNLFVANMPYQARAKDLMEFFKSGNANPISANIIFNENPRKSSGYGFVSFSTKEEAEAALSAFQEKEFMGRSLRVAPSKRFLNENKKSETAPTKSYPSIEQSEEADVA